MSDSYRYDVPAIDDHLRPHTTAPGLYLVGLVHDLEPEQQPVSPSTQLYSRSVAAAVVDARSGLVLAADGWYAYDETKLPDRADPPMVPVVNVLSDWEGDPQMGLLGANRRWLGTEVGRRLLFWDNSPSATAAKLILDRSGEYLPLDRGEVVAAFPLHGEDLGATVARCRSALAGQPGRLGSISPEVQQVHRTLGIIP